jgi:hypothetical protein
VSLAHLVSSPSKLVALPANGVSAETVDFLKAVGRWFQFIDGIGYNFVLIVWGQMFHFDGAICLEDQSMSAAARMIS